MTAGKGFSGQSIQKWVILNRRLVADYRLFKVEEKKVRSPRTGRSMDVQAIHFPDWVVVLPLTANRQTVMIRQYRHGNEQICLEFPGGLVDPEDESPLIAAHRELMEETGLGAKQMIKIGQTFPQPAVLSNRCFFYLALDVEQTGASNFDSGEDIYCEHVPLNDLPAKIEQGEIDNSMTVLAVSFYYNHTFRRNDIPALTPDNLNLSNP